MTLTQDDRMLTIATPLGEDAIILTDFSGNEGISVPFAFELRLASEQGDIAFEDMVGANVTVAITLAEDDTYRFFNGIISRFSQDSGIEEDGGEGLATARYTARMVPWFWLLSKSLNSKIYQDMSVPEIVEQIFTEKGFNDYRLSLGDYTKKEYCVQYNETDFNFISRLLEQEGIFYFFEHENGKHTMVIADSTDVHQPCPHQETAEFHPIAAGEFREGDYITDLDKTQEIRVSKYTVNDFNFTMPTTNLQVEAASRTPLGPGEREVYDYPAEYTSRADGERLANIRMQAEETLITSILGASACRAFTAGYHFELSEYYRSEMNDKRYVLTAVNHTIIEAVGRSGDTSSGRYENTFRCIPQEVPFRPPMMTPKAIIGGVQTAIVVGPGGEDIYTDEYGRVKVQFHWDRYGEHNEDSSCWVRVSQKWAGTGWGAVHIPRIGQEVIVDFLEGDPDRPIITGTVYNGINMPPYALPGDKTRSTLKTMSTPDGGGFNEIRFEDKKGEEQLFIHAENAHDLRIKGSSRESVGGKRHLTVKKDKLEKVEKDKHITVMGDLKEKVDGTVSSTIGGDLQEKITMKHAIDAGQEVHIKGGMKVVVEAGIQATLKGPGGFVDVGPAGVTIQGIMVNINSGGAAGVGSGCSPATPDEPDPADTAEPGSPPEMPSVSPVPPPPIQLTPQAITFQRASQSGAGLCEL